MIGHISPIGSSKCVFISRYCLMRIRLTEMMVSPCSEWTLYAHIQTAKFIPEQMEICGQFRNVCTNPYAKKKLIAWRTTQWWFWWKFIGIMDLVAQSCVQFRWVKEKWISDNDNPLYDILHTYVNNRWLVGGSGGYDYWDRDYWLIIHFTTKTKNSNMKHDHRHRI